MKKIISSAWVVIALVIGIAAAVMASHYLYIERQMKEVIELNARNQGIAISVDYDPYWNPRSLVLNLDHVPDKKAALDIFTVIWYFAGRVKHSNFKRVYFAYRGQKKFYIKGSYFKQLGMQITAAQRMQAIHDFPRHVYTLNHQPIDLAHSKQLLAKQPENQQVVSFMDFYQQWSQ